MEAMSSVLKRLAASLVLIREAEAGAAKSSHGRVCGGGRKFEVLLVQRSKKMKFAKSSWVFPGGVYDPADGNGVQDGMEMQHSFDAVRRICMRECFEEVGILPIKRNFVGDLKVKELEWKEWRARVRQNASEWENFLLSIFGSDFERLGEDGIFAHTKPLCCFLTPEVEAVRSHRQYLTHFFVAKVPRPVGDDVVYAKRPWCNSLVDHEETINSAWISPADALARFKAGSMPMFPPQYYILQRLCGFEVADDILESCSWFAMSRGSGDLPSVMQPEFGSSDECLLALPFDEAHSAHPGPAGARHRFTGAGFGPDLRLVMNEDAMRLVCGGDARPWRYDGSPLSNARL